MSATHRQFARTYSAITPTDFVSDGANISGVASIARQDHWLGSLTRNVLFLEVKMAKGNRLDERYARWDNGHPSPRRG